MTTLPIFATLQPLEKVSVYTPLGIRFWDVAGDVAVTDSLEVTARAPAQPGLRRVAFRTLSGVYAFRNLPGLRDLETADPNLPAGAHPLPTSPPQSHPFIIEVNDRRGRFLPVTFQVELPYRGIYPTQDAGGSPPGPGLPGFFLFSAPSRALGAGLAVVRAQLVERRASGELRPAGHAVLEVLAPGQPKWIGLADERGSVAVVFPYPRFTTSVGPLSPPPSPIGPRVQSWDITIRARYLPAGQTKPDSVASLPDLGSILTQPAADLWPSMSGPGQAELNVQLRFGQPLILQTAGTSELWIET
jgi:hypothetical protein